MDHMTQLRTTTSVRPVVAILMGAVAVSLAVMSSLHLTGGLPGGSPPFQSDGAGIAEAVIAVVLAGATVTVLRAGAYARTTAIAATGFAIVGFLVGLSFTVRGGSTVDVTYHAIGLTVLAVTAALLVKRSSADR